MPKTANEYSVDAVRGRLVADEAITPTAAILESVHTASMPNGGYTFLADFGYLVTWVRYELVPEEFAAAEPGARRAAEAALDQLLEDFAQQDYQPGMGERLLQIGKDDLGECQLSDVYVLPGDLDRLLSAVGNPLDTTDDETLEDEPAEITAAAIGFDLANRTHRQKLADWLIEMGR